MPNPILDALEASTADWTLCALTKRRFVHLASGSGPEVIEGIPRDYLALTRPATGGVVIRRNPTCMVISTARGTSLIANGGRRWNMTSDWEDVALLWSLQETSLVAPPAEELTLRYYLWVALQHRAHVPSDVIAEAAVEYDLETLAHISQSVLIEEASARSIWEVAHQAGRVRTPPPGNASEHDLMAAVTRALPPRWVAAQVIAEAGWPEWAGALLQPPTSAQNES